MALEAGETMHQVFAAVRIWQLLHVQDLPKHAQAVADRIFGKKRWLACLKEADSKDPREQLMQLAFAVLHSSGWVDEPMDTVRTMTNMEMAAIHYVDERQPNMENWPIYVERQDDPSKPIGIEQVFDVVLLYGDGKEIRYIGTIDGLVEKAGTKEYYLDENKTAARLDRGWLASFDMSHQITGYCLACTVVFGFKVFRSRVTGVKIKPTNKGEDCIPLEPIERTEEAFQAWARWLRYTVELYEKYENDYENAPRYTHSCNRYFRPCTLLPFCCDSVAGRKEQYGEMVEANPSPSERAIQEAM
jgi:hypothetical protein